MLLKSWDPATDPKLREGERRLHETLHRKRSVDIPSKEMLFSNPRLRLFPAVEKRVSRVISGQVLDIGCGNGFASAWLALNRPVERVYALEASESAVNMLIPKILKLANVPPGVVQPVLGSFNTIPAVDSFDFIVSFGALHHSSDLLTTLRACLKALKPGGYLLAQEPATDDFVTNAAFVAKYQASEQFADANIQCGDRDDHFFRECEYKTAIHFAGFDLTVFEAARPHLFPNEEPATFQVPSSGAPIPTARLMVAQKPQSPLPFVPHVWTT